MRPHHRGARDCQEMSAAALRETRGVLGDIA
jgi:hypothetical protein